MNILLLNQFFVPDPAPTGKLLADVAHEIASRGHSVTVICARTAYADAPPAAPSELRPLSNGTLRVVRVRTARFRRSIPGRLLSYASFYWGALWHALAAPRADIVLTLTTPPLLSLVGTLVKALRGGRHYIWEMDVYPDIAVALGILKPGSRLARIAGVLARHSRSRADAVIALGTCMRDLLAARGVPSGHIRIAENWADGDLIRPVPLPSAGPLKILYSGNLGLAHEIDTISRVIELLKADSRFRFVFAGGGPRRAGLEEFCRSRGLRNVEFLPYQADSRLSAHFAACHAGLVTQEARSLGAVVPGKVHGLMAAGRPILFIGPANSTSARVLKTWRCGWQVDPGDTAWLVQLLEILSLDRKLLVRTGVNARRAFVDRYSRAAGVCRILRILDLEPSMPLPANPDSTENWYSGRREPAPESTHSFGEPVDGR